MAVKRFSVLDLLGLNLKEHDSLDLRCICGRRGLVREITIPDLNRPGLALSGFYDSFAYQRVQLFGRGEVAFLNKLVTEGKLETIEQMFTYPLPCCIFTHNLDPADEFSAIAENSGCAVLQTGLDSSEFSSRLLRILSNIFAPKISIHGVLVEVYGLGILILGDSGVGKSETALELIERGHRLVADDVVEISCVNGNILIGQGANKIIGHHMEIRGLGIINITQLYGVGSIRERKEVQLVATLEEWDANKVYDRLGTEKLTMDILGVQVPKIEIPVKPGRNVPIILETAAMNERLKSMGYFSAKEFNQNVLKWIESDAARAPYYGDDDSY
ncbi:MAG TPA: HPr(Ser) kinase/phosphatase [Treponemataceae bacterium]|jgi:HPr kinase/phosphorylase|nr:HPr kinase/phosphorylase [Treponema sp.]OQB04235.1 MAG: HPr kinase/phosphorylase [Spirochaetes bacterium ADurb.Bin215]HOF84196.1 HPr(Ser) kinase/phosphatase [Treponemataceae bacterium]HOS35135.1 HPr(Ser) kinase/phosphatase [Treponemataceae bacterium]HOU39321.1 HPr(Ser) kinase/phosphatase [Treponemataceae bacterium]